MHEHVSEHVHTYGHVCVYTSVHDVCVIEGRLVAGLECVMSTCSPLTAITCN